MLYRIGSLCWLLIPLAASAQDALLRDALDLPDNIEVSVPYPDKVSWDWLTGVPPRK